MVFPYRNTVKKDKNFKLDFKKKYTQDFGWEPSGFYYQIRDCLFDFGEIDWGRYYYKVEFKKGVLFNSMKNLRDKKDRKKVVLIKDEKQVDEFSKKYFVEGKGIDWIKVSEKYDGIEIRNFIEISKKMGIKKRYMENFIWFTTLQFSQGCIWNLDVIKGIEYSGKYKKYF